MNEQWRTLLYPLGFVSGLAFGARFIIQWIQSEKQGKSVISRSFWHLSLLGNVLLASHAFIQVQYHVCIIQACNGVISWRNLNLMQKEKPPCSFRSVLGFFVLAALFTTLAFTIQSFFLAKDQTAWFRIPLAPWQSNSSLSLSLSWHIIGFFGYALFSSRFWIQWWLSERSQRSQLPPLFWWISLVGALFSILYFMRIQDSVNLIGPTIGLVPYLRNLMLIQKNPKID